jgi:hypothetical protein
MQVIFMRKTDASCPSRNVRVYAEAARLGFQMLPSKSNTYQSTQATMRPLVDDIISPLLRLHPEGLGFVANSVLCAEKPTVDQFTNWKNSLVGRRKTTQRLSSFLYPGEQ